MITFTVIGLNPIIKIGMIRNFTWRKYFLMQISQLVQFGHMDSLRWPTESWFKSDFCERYFKYCYTIENRELAFCSVSKIVLMWYLKQLHLRSFRISCLCCVKIWCDTYRRPGLVNSSASELPPCSWRCICRSLHGSDPVMELHTW